jgi:murein DD-endopeptidase MepM/ murein hydrolase activator NlpD
MTLREMAKKLHTGSARGMAAKIGLVPPISLLELLTVYRLPFDDTPGWKVTNGNWDDPFHGHDTQPGRAQSFSFDFMYDPNNDNVGEEGQNVRAARSGIVAFAIGSQSVNTWGLHPGDPGYGEQGNTVVIRHVDGTASAYAHLKHNKVFVKGGDSVKRGQVIALSDNTGNASTPHLHFDVHPTFTDWDHWINTIRIRFEDKNHISWIPRVGDALASNNVS